MSYEKETYLRIKAEYSKKYQKAQRRATEHLAEVQAKLPEVWELDRTLATTGMDIMDAIMNGEDPEQKVRELEARNNELLRKRAELLRAAGYPEDYTDVHYECEKCGDTGFVDIRMCDCMRRALVEAAYEASGLGGLIRTQSFENFSLDYYEGETKALVGKNAELLRRFAEEFGNDTYMNFLLIGGTGLGKTHLSTSVAKKIIDRGHDVLYVTSLGMIGDFESKRFGDGNEMKNDTSRYTEAQLLMIDDLGTEVTNQFTIACLYDVINRRMNQRRSTIINTNLSYRELEARYSERITSRLLGEYRPMLFQGKDIRRQKISRESKK